MAEQWLRQPQAAVMPVNALRALTGWDRSPIPPAKDQDDAAILYYYHLFCHSLHKHKLEGIMVMAHRNGSCD